MQQVPPVLLGMSTFAMANLQLQLPAKNVIPLFAHSTFTFHSQNRIYPGYNWLSHHQQNKNALHSETVILNYVLVVTQLAVVRVINHL